MFLQVACIHTCSGFTFKLVYFQVSVDRLPAFQHVSKVIEQLGHRSGPLGPEMAGVFSSKGL
jgi:hypothetical protein